MSAGETPHPKMLELFGDAHVSTKGTSESAHERRNQFKREWRAKQREHSRFKILIDVHDESTCNITQQMKVAELVRKADLIIWDEAPMMHRRAFEAVDRTLRDLM
jgi:hypothetical protein